MGAGKSGVVRSNIITSDQVGMFIGCGVVVVAARDHHAVGGEQGGVRARVRPAGVLPRGRACPQLGDRVAHQKQRVELLPLVGEHVKVPVLELQIALAVDGARHLEGLAREGQRSDAGGARRRRSQVVELPVELHEVPGVVAVDDEFGGRILPEGRVGGRVRGVRVADGVASTCTWSSCRRRERRCTC